MGAVTAALTVGGLAMSAAQYAKANKAQKQAEASAKSAMADLKAIQEVNPFRETQIPTLGFELAQQSQQQQMAQSVDYLKSLGAAGAGMIPGLTQQSNAQQLRMAAQAGEFEYQRDRDEASAQALIESRRADREFKIGAEEVKGAQAAALEARQQKQAAIEGAFKSVATGLSSIDPSAYGNKNKPSGAGAGASSAISGFAGEGNILERDYGGNAELMKFSEDAMSQGKMGYNDWLKTIDPAGVGDLFTAYKEYTWGI